MEIIIEAIGENTPKIPPIYPKTSKIEYILLE
jgi:hypothetical protein